MNKILILNNQQYNITYEEMLDMLNVELNKWSYKFARRYFKQHKEDLLQDARLFAWNAYNKYDHTKGIDFKTYLYKTLERRFIRVREKYDKVYNDECIVDFEMMENVPEPEESDLIDSVKSILNDKELMLLEYLTGNIDVSKFCKDRNLPYKKTQREIKILKEKVKNYVETRK